MELNEAGHKVYCFDAAAALPSNMDNARGEIYLIRRLLSQDLEVARVTRQTPSGARSPAAKWRKVNNVHGFTFHAAYLSKQAAARRKRDDLLYTASYRWRNLILFKCFASWKDIWTTKFRTMAKPSRRLNALYPGNTGLRNLGNTCYMNAALQSLSHVTLLKNAVMSASTVGPPGALLWELKHVMQRLWSGKYAALSPDAILAVVWQTFPTLAGFKQQDCDELLRHLLDSMRSGAASVVDPPLARCFVDALFEGVVVRTITCNRCMHESSTNEMFLGVLSVDIPTPHRVHAGRRRRVATAHCSMIDCLATTFAAESLQRDAQYFCSNCDAKQDAVKLTQLGAAPPVIIFHVNRTGWTADGEPDKIPTHVAFPERGLDLSMIMAAPPRTSTVYDLDAAIVHEGRTLTQGHYTAYANNALGGAGWFHFNDHRVHKCTWKDVASAQAYLLVYSQRQTNSQPRPHGSQCCEASVRATHGAMDSG
ncbi:hypothetical protein, variant 1 [Aphanomyces invadans]|nr:hypothetical protein, variant 1 [Aphanomyces invadans]ETV97767.1 hypothetical protein, variant 1 [Aphanomyces invadans]|eukprot:XP_008873328.1 hypothetical protein, variant 1 [Aphanomyces invadans]